MAGLLRTAIKDRAIVLVAINQLDRTVGLHRESDIAQHGPGGKLALEVRINAFTVALSMEESADADLGMDLLGGDFHLKLGGVAAIAFAGDVLRVASGERKIIFRRRNCGGARGKGKSDAADKWMDGFHYDPPTFSTSNLHQDCKRSPRPAGSGAWLGSGEGQRLPATRLQAEKQWVQRAQPRPSRLLPHQGVAKRLSTAVQRATENS
jgi:hypothetical protein